MNKYLCNNTCRFARPRLWNERSERTSRIWRTYIVQWPVLISRTRRLIIFVSCVCNLSIYSHYRLKFCRIFVQSLHILQNFSFIFTLLLMISYLTVLSWAFLIYLREGAGRWVGGGSGKGGERSTTLSEKKLIVAKIICKLVNYMAHFVNTEHISGVFQQLGWKAKFKSRRKVGIKNKSIIPRHLINVLAIPFYLSFNH